VINGRFGREVLTSSQLRIGVVSLNENSRMPTRPRNHDVLSEHKSLHKLSCPAWAAYSSIADGTEHEGFGSEKRFLELLLSDYARVVPGRSAHLIAARLVLLHVPAVLV